jgi:hypothetical protein
MDQTIIDDFKQFITATISQQFSNVATKDDIASLDQKIDVLDRKLSGKIDELQSSVATALDNSNDTVDDQLQDHERRIAKLEHRPA